MALITPRNQPNQLTQIINTLGAGIDRFSQAKRQREKDEAENQLRGLQTQQAQQGVESNKMSLDAQKEKQGVLGQIAGLQDAPNEPFEGGLGPISMEKSGEIKSGLEDRKSKLIQKFQILNGKIPESQDEIKLRQSGKILDLQGKGLDLEGKRLDIKKKQLDLNKTLADMEKIANGAQPITEKTAKIERELRKEFVDLSGQFMDQRDAFGRVAAVGKSKTAAGDLALIFNFMKILDPRSVVRESEFRSAEQAKSWLSSAEDQKIPIPSFIKTAIQKIDPSQSGAFLLPSQRQDFLNQAESLFVEAEKQHEKRANTYQFIASQYGDLGVRPELVVTDLGTTSGRVGANLGENNNFGPQSDGSFVKPPGPRFNPAGPVNKNGRFNVINTPLNPGQSMSLEIPGL